MSFCLYHNINRKNDRYIKQKNHTISHLNYKMQLTFLEHPDSHFAASLTGI